MKKLMFAVAVSFCAAVPVFAENSFIREVSLEVDAVETIDVAACSETVIERIKGERGTIVKTGGGTLRILMMHNSKVRFDVQGGKVFFDRQMPRVCADAFLHVDASRPDTLELEEQNGTNFVVRWNDVRGNGMFATNCLAGPAWRTNPENRRAYISDVTQNGLPVVDFGPVLYEGHAEGYGATMIWSKTCTNAYEVYEVIADTPDTEECGRYTSYISSSLDRAGNYRGEQGSDKAGHIFHDNRNAYGWALGSVYHNGRLTNPNSAGMSGKWKVNDEGMSLLGFATCVESPKDVDGKYTNYAARVNSFARDYNYTFGGQRIAEYLVFTNRLDSTDREILLGYLNCKWRGVSSVYIESSYIVSSLTVAPEASVEFAQGVSVEVANISEGADLTVEKGSLELNSLINPEAYFHVDADALNTLSLDEQNGTNFVNRWDDVLSNGVYATASTKTFGDWLKDPENRRPFISEEKLNNRNVIDFGPLQVHSHTNEFGEGLGYGASMQWSSRMTSAAPARDLFAVVRDTDDVKTLYGTGNVNVTEFGQAYICDPTSRFGFRGKLLSNTWPVIAHDQGYNAEIKNSSIYADGVLKHWEASVGAGFHVMQFILPGSQDRKIRPSHFAYSYTKTSDRHILGGTKIAEYIVFDHPLDPVVRTNIYTALRTKWFNDARTVRKFGNLTVGAGASLSIPWNDVVVTNCLTVGGNLTVASVSAAAIRLASTAADVSGNLTLEDGAAITVDMLADGTFASLSATQLEFLGGGKVVFSALAGLKPRVGKMKILSGGFTAPLENLTVDASAIPKFSVCLKEKEDGLYAVISPKGTVLLVR